jgi:hypothetical protein
MKPLDLASAQFNVAKAYYAEGDKGQGGGQRAGSLEAAPGFKDAQKFLLQIEADKSGQDTNTVTNQPK